MRKIVFLGLLFVIMQSCRTQKDVVYFQNINQVVSSNLPDDYSEPTIQVGDELMVIVSSTSQELAQPFNLTINNNPNFGSKSTSYLVDSKGYINMPILGLIKAEGKTREELSNFVRGKLEKKYLDNPTVNVRINNYRVVMLGEFKNPGIKTFNSDKVTVLDAIGSAGDLKFTAIRDSVLVIRNIDGVRTKGYLNLLDANSMKSPYFYIKQNDIVYAMPTKSASMAFNNLPVNVALSLIGFTVTIIALFK